VIVDPKDFLRRPTPMSGSVEFRYPGPCTVAACLEAFAAVAGTYGVPADAAVTYVSVSTDAAGGGSTWRVNWQLQP
jgi:hypothetical protein